MNSQFAGLSTQNSQFGALSDPQETGNLQGPVNRLRRLSPNP